MKQPSGPHRNRPCLAARRLTAEPAAPQDARGAVAPKLIAIVGGSGAGKSWLIQRLQRQLGPALTRFSQDDFYRDRSDLSWPGREKINYDNPKAIEWPRLQQALRGLRAGQPVAIPQYDFSMHSRRAATRVVAAAPVIMVDGLWLALRREVRALFDFMIYLDCPAQLRLERRLARDVAERGRCEEMVRQQFWKTVSPMHDRFVARQVHRADIILRQPPSEFEIRNLAAMIRALIKEGPGSLQSQRHLSAAAAGVARTTNEARETLMTRL